MAKKRKAASQAVPQEEVEEEDCEEAEDEDEEEIVDAEAEENENDEEEEDEGPKMVWRPGVDVIEDGEQLDVEPGTYDMLHRAQVEWPCLSLDVVRDDLGAQRTSYPMTAYVVAGSQASKTEDNRLYMMKWHKLYKTSKDGKEDDEDESEEEEDSEDEHEAALESKTTPHPGGVNRVRAMPQAGHIVATWADTGKVHMWNLEAHRKALDKSGDKAPAHAKPIFTSEAHKDEGFAMDFSPHDTGRFLSGGNDALIMMAEPVPGGWKVASDQPFKAHKSSVEDVQWKKLGAGEKSSFASCSSDGSWKVWDIREKDRKKPAINVPDAHDGTDVNVLSGKLGHAQLEPHRRRVDRNRSQGEDKPNRPRSAMASSSSGYAFGPQPTGDATPAKSWDDERIHLSMAQLQNELLRVEDACRAWQAEEAAPWQLPMRGVYLPDASRRHRGASHSPKPRLRRGACSVEEAVSARLVEVRGESGLRDLLAKQCRATEVAKARQQQLREELDAASRDAEQLAAGLPELLEKRRAEVERRRRRATELHHERWAAEACVERLEEELSEVEAQALHLQSGVELWAERQTGKKAQLGEVQQELESMEARRSKAKAWLQEIYQGHLHPQSIEKTRHLRGHHIPSLELQSAQLARQLEERKESYEAQCLAQQVEVDTLRRSLALRTQRLRAKEQESAWLQWRADALEQELAHLQSMLVHMPLFIRRIRLLAAGPMPRLLGKGFRQDKEAGPRKTEFFAARRTLPSNARPRASMLQVKAPEGKRGSARTSFDATTAGSSEAMFGALRRGQAVNVGISSIMIEQDLVEVPMFRNCSASFISRLAQDASETTRAFGVGQVVHEVGDAGKSMVLVLRGSLVVKKKGEELLQLEQRSHYGETMLLSLEQVWRVSLIASASSMVCEIRRESFRRLLEDFPAEAQQYEMFFDIAMDQLFSGTRTHTCDIFTGLSQKMLEAFDEHMLRRVYFPGEIVLHDGPQSKELVLLQDGMAAVEIAGRTVRTETRGKKEDVAGRNRLRSDHLSDEDEEEEEEDDRPACFGELEFLGLSPVRKTAVKALTPCVCRILNREMVLHVARDTDMEVYSSMLLQMFQKTVHKPSGEQASVLMDFISAGCSDEFLQFLSGHLEARLYPEGKLPGDANLAA
ncbi:rrb1 [Symbiodinium natans]|uniref:Rrb1 protein n=1 Tax=Symbiodinium natans TaxID=878477 RepID=A0A812NSV1_9DINO|nr:rrb1 [Symbiodinium natans]